jgi:hypothetical protein
MFARFSMKAPYVFLGDEAFPPIGYVMRPFPQAQLRGEENGEFNYRLSRTRMVVECSFISIATKLRLLRKATKSNVENAVHVVKAITLVHTASGDLEGFTELEVHKFTAVRAYPGGYMPPSKRNNALFRKDVFARITIYRIFKLRPLVRTYSASVLQFFYYFYVISLTNMNNNIEKSCFSSTSISLLLL